MTNPWTDLASVVGAEAAPWMEDPDAHVDAVAARAAAAWKGRVDHAHPFLSSPARSTLWAARDDLASDAAHGAGYEKLAAVREGSTAALWFLDAPADAWALLLRRLRDEGHLVGLASERDLDRLEAAWREGAGAAHREALSMAANGHPSAAVLLHLAPLALFEGGDPLEAMAALDQAMSYLPTEVLREVGVGAPLTYGLLHAAAGDLRAAAQAVSMEGGLRNVLGWTGFLSDEARYHRARYLACLQDEEAADLAAGVIHADPSYLIRILSDPVWCALPAEQARVLERTLEAADPIPARVRAWYGRRMAGDEDASPVRRVVEALEVLGDEPYVRVVLASLIEAAETWQTERVRVSVAFEQALRRVHDRVRDLPERLPVRIEGPVQARLRGGPDSLLETVNGLIRAGRIERAALLIDWAEEELAFSVRTALMAYLAAMGVAIRQALSVLEADRSPEGAERRTVLEQLDHALFPAVAQVQALPPSIGDGFSQAVTDVWQIIAAAEAAWARADERAFGRIRIEPESASQLVPAGAWGSVVITLTDTAGRPVAGVPVLWTPASGRARPRDPAPCLDVEWAVSTATGMVHLTLEAPGVEETGALAVRLLGEGRVVAVPYQVGAPLAGVLTGG